MSKTTHDTSGSRHDPKNHNIMSETSNAIDSRIGSVTATSHVDQSLQHDSMPSMHSPQEEAQDMDSALRVHNHDLGDGGRDSADNDVLPMDGLEVLAPTRGFPELHPRRSDRVFDLAVFDSHGWQIPLEIGERRSLFPMATAEHLAKHAIFICPIPGCRQFYKSETILDVYNHLDDDEHGIELYTHKDMARCPANCGYSAINAHHLSMFYMPKCPSINVDELNPDHLFDCTHCDTIAPPLTTFAYHWDMIHAVAELHSSTIACEICSKGFEDSALLLPVHCGHFGTQSDCLSSEHFRILDQIDLLWEPPSI
ncbi:hypothetical protein QM012_007523 [Aureobasidium pullulans]|uniref:C2H2-type domain-containing protein n=1 Tax=Aureobasidium pullulans TaxID=5580 RepID=A0ABR0TN65_AURPU